MADRDLSRYKIVASYVLKENTIFYKYQKHSCRHQDHHRQDHSWNYSTNSSQLQPEDKDDVILTLKKWTVPELRKWLGLRGIRTNDCSKEEIVELAYYAWKLKIPFNASEVELQREAGSRLEELLSVDGCKLPDPTGVLDWSTDLQKLPTITNHDIYEYLINSPGKCIPSLKKLSVIIRHLKFMPF